jgi:hypothetical protein
MKASIVLAVAAVLLTLCPQRGDARGYCHRGIHCGHPSGLRHHRAAKPKAAPDEIAGTPLDPDSAAGRRLPNFFKNCEHPARWFCWHY